MGVLLPIKLCTAAVFVTWSDIMVPWEQEEGTEGPRKLGSGPEQGYGGTVWQTQRGHRAPSSEPSGREAGSLGEKQSFYGDNSQCL